MPLPSVNYIIGSPFIELQSVDSSNNYALARVHEKLAKPGTCYFAHEQTAGKGQRGRTWATEKGANITLSLVLNPGFLQPSGQFQLSACVATAVRAFFSKHAGEETSIKWPNDLYWSDRKAGGILIENILGSAGDNEPVQWKWAIAGIGININQTHFAKEVKNAVSLKQITGKSYNCVELAKELCSTIDLHFRQLADKGPASVFEQYHQHLYKINRSVKLKKESRVFEAVIRGVSPDGRLITQHAFEEKFNAGEIEWVL